MRKPILFLLFLIASASFKIGAQTQTIPPFALPNEVQWEYLAATVNETNVNKPFNNIENLQPTRIKTNTLPYGYERNGKIYFAYLFNFVRVQAAIDSLGKNGWELVGIVPPDLKNGTSSPNETGLIFKRKFDRNRSEREFKYWRRRELTQIAKFEQTSPDPNEIIDLDDLELRKKTVDLRRDDERKLRQALEKVKNVSLKINKVSSGSYYSEKQAKFFDAFADVTIDGSAALLKDGNKFRFSEAKKYLKEKADDIFNQIGLRAAKSGDQTLPTFFENGFESGRGNTLIKINLVLNYQGKSKTVTEGFLRGDFTDVTNSSSVQ